MTRCFGSTEVFINRKNAQAESDDGPSRNGTRRKGDKSRSSEIETRAVTGRKNELVG